MSNIKNKKVLSYVLALALIVSLFAGLTVTASAATTATTITSLSQITNMAGSYKLGNNISISASSWTPIGTSSAPFTGTFDGGGYTITWSGSATGSSYWGVFGYSTGVIANVKTAGTLTLTGSGSYVSPLVGYSSGSVYNCQNSATFTANNMDNAGGVVGALETTSSTKLSKPIMIQYCGNSGNITASKRVGGVVGAVYCNVKGNAVVDQCYSKNCTIYTKTTSSKVWSGGLAGYVKGGITNSYSNAIALKASGGHYLSGLIGILNGNSPSAYAEDCYANVASYTGCSSSYDRPFVGSVDSSANVTLDDCWWTENVSGYTQNYTASGWGTQNNVGIIDSSWSNLTLDTTTYFNTGSQPTLKWESNSSFTYDVSNGTAGTSGDSSTTLESGIILGGSSSGAYTTLASAIAATTSSDNTIYVAGTIDLPTGTYSGATNSVIIKRSQTFNGVLFTVNSGATVTLSNLIFDGNNSNVTGTNLIRVYGGTVTLTSDTFRNATSGASGAALHVQGGTVTATNTTFTNCTAMNGGAVAISKTSSSVAGSFTMSGGSITSCTATKYGGAVYMTGGTFTLSGSYAISGSIYLANGTYLTLNAAVPSSYPLTVVSSETASGTKIASCSTALIASNSRTRITVNGSNPVINSTDTKILEIA